MSPIASKVMIVEVNPVLEISQDFAIRNWYALDFGGL